MVLPIVLFLPPEEAMVLPIVLCLPPEMTPHLPFNSLLVGLLCTLLPLL